MKKETLKRLGVPTFFLFLFLIPALTLDTLILQVSSELIRRTSWIGRYVIGTGLWLTLAWLVVRVIDDIGWPLLFDQRSGYVIPRLFKDFVHTVVFAVAVGVILSMVFQTSLTGLITASGVVGLVLGFALRNTIADFFSGISLNLERSFTIGDRIQLESGERGEVVEINWRTTIIKTLLGNHIIVPNSRISSMRIENHDKPAKPTKQFLELYLDFDVPPERAIRILKAAVTQAQAGIAAGFDTSVLCSDITERGVKYLVVYTVPEYPYMRARSEVLRSILHHLALADICPGYTKYETYTREMPLRQLEQQASPHNLLKQVALFTVLDDSELTSLAARMTPCMFTAGDVIVAQGEAGTSMYLVAEGLLHVYVARPESADLIQVGQLIPGQFFGEMSLLTGEPRSATVKAATDVLVYEITKEDIELLLEKRPEIAERLTETIAKHRLHNEALLQSRTNQEQAAEVQYFAAQLLAKMRRFFGVFRGVAALKDQP
jgi:small-conductance mechanosensitive channel/CRP-like cAMP-binding protein